AGALRAPSRFSPGPPPRPPSNAVRQRGPLLGAKPEADAGAGIGHPRVRGNVEPALPRRGVRGEPRDGAGGAARPV
ncbi:MAG: hypothetical protein AVDCRST_MAG59-2669, partial [uncultured Thermomicrobiales bacterium]